MFYINRKIKKNKITVILIVFLSIICLQNKINAVEIVHNHTFFLEDPFGKFITSEKDLAYIITLDKKFKESQFIYVSRFKVYKKTAEEFKLFLNDFSEISIMQYQFSLDIVHFKFAESDYDLNKIDNIEVYLSSMNLFPNQKQRKIHHYKYSIMPPNNNYSEIVVRIFKENTKIIYDYTFNWNKTWYLSSIKKINNE